MNGYHYYYYVFIILKKRNENIAKISTKQEDRQIAVYGKCGGGENNGGGRVNNVNHIEIQVQPQPTQNRKKQFLQREGARHINLIDDILLIHHLK